jgi:hypothetical protein
MDAEVLQLGSVYEAGCVRWMYGARGIWLAGGSARVYLLLGARCKIGDYRSIVLTEIETER